MSVAGTESALAEGAANCVVDCAGTREGQSLFVVSQSGAVEDEVVAAITVAGRDRGARVEVIWADPIPRDTPEAIPANVLAAWREGDVVISHFPSLKREALVPHFGAETRVRVPNRARTALMLASDWARFPYRLQRAVADYLDGRMSHGREWRITGPDGTDVRGVFGDAGGAVGAAFFVDSGEEGRARRNFPGGVHSPRSCAALDGVIMCDYIDNVDMDPGDEPLRIELSAGRVMGLSGGDKAGLVRAAIEASDGFIDSWHAGVHPRTLVPVKRDDNAREWFSYSHCSPAILHFHLGRSHDTTNIGVFGHSLSVAGELLYEHGHLTVFEVPEIAEIVKETGVGPDMLESRAIAPW